MVICTVISRFHSLVLSFVMGAPLLRKTTNMAECFCDGGGAWLIPAQSEPTGIFMEDPLDTPYSAERCVRALNIWLFRRLQGSPNKLSYRDWAWRIVRGQILWACGK